MVKSMIKNMHHSLTDFPRKKLMNKEISFELHFGFLLPYLSENTKNVKVPCKEKHEHCFFYVDIAHFH